MSNVNDHQTDGARLQLKFDALKAEKGMKKAEFARVFKVPGGASMVSQNISGHRPISLDAMVAYAKGFGCGLAEISPDLASQLQEFMAKPGQPLTLVEKVQPIATFADAVRVIAERLMDVDESTSAMAMTVLGHLAQQPEEYEKISRAVLAVLESGKRRRA